MAALLPSPPPAPPARLPRLRRLRTALWGLGVTALVAAATLFRPPLLQLIEYKIFDTHLATTVGERSPLEPVLVNIDETSLQKYGQWPWPRSRVAALLTRLAAMKPAAVAVDLLFPEAERVSPPGGLEAAPDGVPEMAASASVSPSRPTSASSSRFLRRRGSAGAAA